jgi:hypothetical protein
LRFKVLHIEALFSGAHVLITLRYEDNFDAVNNVAIIAQPTDKSSIDQLGAPDAFVKSLGFLFGKQAFAGE